MKKSPRGQSRAVPRGKSGRNQPSREVWSAFGGAPPASIASRPLDFQRCYLEGLRRQAFAATVCDEDSRGVPVARNFRIISAVWAHVAKRSPRRGTAVNFTPGMVGRLITHQWHGICFSGQHRLMYAQIFFKASALERGDAPVIGLAIATSSDAFAYAGIRR
jgi:hypothetical protein